MWSGGAIISANSWTRYYYVAMDSGSRSAALALRGSGRYDGSYDSSFVYCFPPHHDDQLTVQSQADNHHRLNSRLIHVWIAMADSHGPQNRKVWSEIAPLLIDLASPRSSTSYD
jgi:hypothetical protein